MDELPTQYQIHDNRSVKSMTKISFSGHAKKDVTYEFYHTVMNSLLPKALHWAVEMHVSGYDKLLWDTILDIYWRNINIQNPKLMFYLYELQQQIHELKHPSNSSNTLDRNHPMIRHRIADAVILVGQSNKNDLFFRRIYPKVTENDFTYNSMRNMIQSDNTRYSDPYGGPSDSSDITLTMNEISYCLQHRNQDRFRYCIYWYTWMNRRAQLYRKETGQDLAVGYRDISEIDAKYKRDWIWPIWLITIDCIKQSHDAILDNVMKINYHFYKQGFTSATKEKKKIYLHLVWYYYFNLDSIDMQHLVGLDSVQRIQGIAQVHDIYKSVMERRPAHLAIEVTQGRRIRAGNKRVSTTLTSTGPITNLSSYLPRHIQPTMPLSPSQSQHPNPIKSTAINDDDVEYDQMEDENDQHEDRANNRIRSKKKSATTHSIDPRLEKRLQYMESYVPTITKVSSPLDLLIRQQSTATSLPVKTITTSNHSIDHSTNHDMI